MIICLFDDSIIKSCGKLFFFSPDLPADRQVAVESFWHDKRYFMMVKKRPREAIFTNNKIVWKTKPCLAAGRLERKAGLASHLFDRTKLSNQSDNRSGNYGP